MRKVAVLVVLSALLVPAGLAEAGERGRCRMQLFELQTRVRVHYVLRTPTTDRRWRFKIMDEGDRVYHHVYRTDERGNFSVWVRIPRRPGYRMYEGVAVDLVTGDRCGITLRT